MVNYISHGIAKKPPRGNPPQGRSEPEQGEQRAERRRCAGELHAEPQPAGAVGKIDLLIGREKEVERVIQTPAAGARTTRCWSARPAWARPRSPKAWRVASSRASVPEILTEAGVRARHGCAARRHQGYRGDFERRLKACWQLIENPNAILFIDEIHTVIGAGAASGGTPWTPPTCSSRRCPGQLRASARPPSRNFARFSRRTTRWPPASRRSTWSSRPWRDRRDPQGPQAEASRSTTTASSTERGDSSAAVSCRPSYINDRHLPDKAIDVIDEAGAPSASCPSRSSKKTIGKNEIEDHRRQDGPHPAAHRVQRRQGAAQDPSATSRTWCSARMPRSRPAGDQDVAPGLGNPQKPIGSSCSPAPPASEDRGRPPARHTLGIELVRFDMSGIHGTATQSAA